MTQKERIVVVTNPFDAHADTVIIKLREMGYQPVRLHSADFPVTSLVTLTFEQQRWHGTLALPRTKLDSDTIKSIWWRRPEPYVLPADLTADEQTFVRKETDITFKGLWNVLDCYWMSFPPNIRRASNKIDQLQRAATLGLRVPRTLITNDPDQARAFYEMCDGRIVYKTLSTPKLKSDGEEYLIYTSSVTPDLLKVIDAVRTAPCQFQELVPKQYELRVTIIGSDIFICEIHSQQHARTSIDWRHYDVSIPYKKGTLPPDMIEKCFALTKSYGLNYSAMDFILTPEGEYVFLENNPNGQCFFIQQYIPEFKMDEAIASCLVKGKD